MSTKRIFAVCLFIALMAVAASAQSNDRGATWKKYFGRNATPAPSQTVEAERQKDDTPQSDSSQSDVGINATVPAKYRLEGTWQTTVSFSDGFVLKVLFTFMAGRDENEGTLIDTNEFLLTPDPIGTPDQGVWQRIVDRSFIATHLAFLFNSADGSPAGTAKVRDAINMSDNDHFTGRQYVEGFDTNGNLIFSVQATMTGVRLKAQAPPAF
jgi:hypothetical protein